MGFFSSRAPFASSIALLVGSVSVLGQETRVVPMPHQAEVRLGDGSLVRVVILQESLEVMTRYGKLSVPVREIRRIDFGLHVPDTVEKQIDRSIQQLGSQAYREREDAVKLLVHHGSTAYPFLRKVSHSPDAETAQRVATVMKRISDKVAAEDLRIKDHDVIQTQEFPIIGRVLASTIKAHSSHFGPLDLKLSDLRTLFVRGQNLDNELLVDASKHGSATDQWLDSGLTVEPGQKLVIVSEGQVDLWPQGPGQYVTTPKGYTAAGKGGSFMAGSLVGRIGTNGKVFLVGERFEGQPSEEGKLFFHIVPSPWNNASAGNYRVRISTEHVSLSARR